MTDKKRGRCPVCDRDMLLKADGTLRHHGGPAGTGMWNDYRSYECDGVGQLPKSPEEPPVTLDDPRHDRTGEDRTCHC